MTVRNMVSYIQYVLAFFLPFFLDLLAQLNWFMERLSEIGSEESTGVLTMASQLRHGLKRLRIPLPRDDETCTIVDSHDDSRAKLTACIRAFSANCGEFDTIFNDVKYLSTALDAMANALDMVSDLWVYRFCPA